ncbi:hypothetical protein ACFO3A_14015 [Comamonas nitrativorans]|uniref:Uncharacterized protein n=1 Tax=Comamonas nitrativorans TaxID=108437 RepID=A0ABV9H1U3_9BURK
MPGNDQNGKRHGKKTVQTAKNFSNNNFFLLFHQVNPTLQRLAKTYPQACAVFCRRSFPHLPRIAYFLIIFSFHWQNNTLSKLSAACSGFSTSLCRQIGDKP